MSLASVGKAGAVVTLLILFFVVNLEERTMYSRYYHPHSRSMSSSTSLDLKSGGGYELRYILGELSLGEPQGEALPDADKRLYPAAAERLSKIRDALQMSEFYHPSSGRALHVPSLLLPSRGDETAAPLLQAAAGGERDGQASSGHSFLQQPINLAAGKTNSASTRANSISRSRGDVLTRPYASKENPPFHFEHLIPGTYGPECNSVPGGQTRKLACEFNATLQHVEQCNEPETAGGSLVFDQASATLVWQSKSSDGKDKTCAGDEYYIETRPFGSETMTAPNKLVYFNDHSFVGDGRYEFKMRGHPTMAPPIKGTDFYKKHPMRNLCKRKHKHCSERPPEYPPEAIVSPCCLSLRRPMNISVSVRLHYTNGWGMKPPPFKKTVGGPNAANTVVFDESIMIYTCMRPEKVAAQAQLGLEHVAEKDGNRSEAAAAAYADNLRSTTQRFLLEAALKAEGQCTFPRGVEKFAHWVFFGDSLTEQMYAVTPSTLGRDPNHNFWYIPRLPSPTQTAHNPRLPLTNDSSARAVYMETLENFTHPGGPDAYKDTAVLISSGMWEVLSNVHSDLFVSHIDAYAAWLDKAIALFPGSTIVAKNVNAVHLHRAENCNTQCQNRLMYMSNSRVALLNQMQAVEVKKRKLVEFEQYTYTASVAHRTKRNDARHFNIWTNVVLWSMLQETMKAVDAEGSVSACKALARPLHCSPDGTVNLP